MRLTPHQATHLLAQHLQAWLPPRQHTLIAARLERTPVEVAGARHWASGSSSASAPLVEPDQQGGVIGHGGCLDAPQITGNGALQRRQSRLGRTRQLALRPT